MFEGVPHPVRNAKSLFWASQVAVFFDKLAGEAAIVVLNLNIFFFQNILNQIFIYHTGLKKMKIS